MVSSTLTTNSVCAVRPLPSVIVKLYFTIPLSESSTVTANSKLNEPLFSVFVKFSGDSLGVSSKYFVTTMVEDAVSAEYVTVTAFVSSALTSIVFTSKLIVGGAGSSSLHEINKEKAINRLGKIKVIKFLDMIVSFKVNNQI